MSNISANSNDPSKIREYYTRRESEIEEKHHGEVDSLRKSQAEDLERLRTSAGGQIDEAKAKMQEKITDQDKKHLAEIESLKAMYQRKIEEMARKKES
jgi:membrane protein involved in colicin uptake